LLGVPSSERQISKASVEAVHPVLWVLNEIDLIIRPTTRVTLVSKFKIVVDVMW
jgi:hypothetical protein